MRGVTGRKLPSQTGVLRLPDLGTEKGQDTLNSKDAQRGRTQALPTQKPETRKRWMGSATGTD